MDIHGPRLRLNDTVDPWLGNTSSTNPTGHGTRLLMKSGLMTLIGISCHIINVIVVFIAIIIIIIIIHHQHTMATQQGVSRI